MKTPYKPEHLAMVTGALLFLGLSIWSGQVYGVAGWICSLGWILEHTLQNKNK